MSTNTYAFGADNLVVLSQGTSYAYVVGTGATEFSDTSIATKTTTVQLKTDKSGFIAGAGVDADNAKIVHSDVVVGANLALKVNVTELMKVAAFPSNKLLSIKGKYFVIGTSDACFMPKSGVTDGTVEACGDNLKQIDQTVAAGASSTSYFRVDGVSAFFYIDGSGKFLEKNYKELFDSTDNAKVFIKDAPASNPVDQVIFTSEKQKLILSYKAGVASDECYLSDEKQAAVTSCPDIVKGKHMITSKNIPVWNIGDKKFVSFNAITEDKEVFTVADLANLKITFGPNNSASLLWLWIFIAVVVIALIVIATIMMRKHMKK